MDYKELLLPLIVSVVGSLAGAFAGGISAFQVSMREVRETNKNELMMKIGQIFSVLSEQARIFLKLADKIDENSTKTNSIMKGFFVNEEYKLLEGLTKDLYNNRGFIFTYIKNHVKSVKTSQINPLCSGLSKIAEIIDCYAKEQEALNDPSKPEHIDSMKFSVVMHSREKIRSIINSFPKEGVFEDYFSQLRTD